MLRLRQGSAGFGEPFVLSGSRNRSVVFYDMQSPLLLYSPFFCCDAPIATPIAIPIAMPVPTLPMATPIPTPIAVPIAIPLPIVFTLIFPYPDEVHITILELLLTVCVNQSFAFASPR